MTWQVRAHLIAVALGVSAAGSLAATLAQAPFASSSYTEPPASVRFTPAKAGMFDRDLTYCRAGGVDLKFDIYYPRTSPAEKFPLVIYIHGGEFLFGSKAAVIGPNAPIRGPQYTARGFAFASLDYRLGPAFKLPTMIEDVKCAVRHLRARAASYNIDPDHIGVIGSSSGAYLGAMLGLTDASAGFEGRGAFTGTSSRVQAVVAEYPQVTLEGEPFSKAETDSRNGTLPRGATADFRRRMSLPTYVSGAAPPFMFFHGDADPGLSPARSRDLHDKLVAAGVDSTYVLVKNAGHGWLATSPRRANTIYAPDPDPQRILTQELSFFEKHLKSAPAAPRAAGPPAAPAATAGPAVFHSPTLEAYQSVENAVAGNQYVAHESDDYSVTLTQAGRTIKSFTHKSVSPNIQPREAVVRQMSWTQFSFQGEVQVDVRSLRGPFRAFQVLPSRRAIRVESPSPDTRRFTLTTPAQLAVLVNDDDRNPLFIYASPMLDHHPAAGEPGVVVVAPGRHSSATVATYASARTLLFEPGVHLLDATLTVSPGQHVHVPAGAFVLGQVAGTAPNLAGLRIDGRGVISGQHRGPLEYTEATMISLVGGAAFRPPAAASPYQVEISGLTLADLPSFAIRAYAVPGVHVANVNIGPGWHFKTDGIVAGERALVEDVFFNCNDDSMKTYFSDSEWRRLTVWQGTNGAVVQFSWNTMREVRNVWLHEIDVVRAQMFREAPHHALFGSMHATPGNVHDIRIENVTVEGPVFRLFRIGSVYEHAWSGGPGRAGPIGDITFRNVTVTAVPSEVNDFLVCLGAKPAQCPNSSLGAIRFENLRIAGKPIRSLEELRANVDPRDRGKITFQ